MEEPLLSVDDVEQALPPPPPDSLPKENAQSLWDLMTFESIAPVMNHGITKQLNFKDLLSLPDDMEPSVCHSVLISCWQAQESRPDPFLLKSIFYAYGWPYLKLGLLKSPHQHPLLLKKRLPMS